MGKNDQMYVEKKSFKCLDLGDAVIDPTIFNLKVGKYMPNIFIEYRKVTRRMRKKLYHWQSVVKYRDFLIDDITLHA